MTATPQRMDTSLTAIKDAIMAAQQDFQADIALFPMEALCTAGAVLNELSGPIERLLAEFTRDAERPVGRAQSATPKGTGLTATNIRGIRKAHRNITDDEYQKAKADAAGSGKRFTRVLVCGVDPSVQPKKRQNATKQLQEENAQLKRRVSILENTLLVHQIPLPEFK